MNAIPIVIILVRFLLNAIPIVITLVKFLWFIVKPPILRSVSVSASQNRPCVRSSFPSFPRRREELPIRCQQNVAGWEMTKHFDVLMGKQIQNVLIGW